MVLRECVMDQRKLLVVGIEQLFVMFILLLTGCVQAPVQPVNSNLTGLTSVVLEARDDKNDWLAKLVAVETFQGVPVPISTQDIRLGYLSVEAGKYQLAVQCFKDEKKGLSARGKVSGYYILRAGELWRIRFMPEEPQAEKECPVFFVRADK